MVDAMLMMQTMQSSMMYQSKATNELADQCKVGFCTDIEASVVTSFTTVVPEVLAG
jgi:hypothetical protein